MKVAPTAVSGRRLVCFGPDTGGAPRRGPPVETESDRQSRVLYRSISFTGRMGPLAVIRASEPERLRTGRIDRHPTDGVTRSVPGVAGGRVTADADFDGRPENGESPRPGASGDPTGRERNAVPCSAPDRRPTTDERHRVDGRPPSQTVTHRPARDSGSVLGGTLDHPATERRREATRRNRRRSRDGPRRGTRAVCGGSTVDCPDGVRRDAPQTATNGGRAGS